MLVNTFAVVIIGEHAAEAENHVMFEYSDFTLTTFVVIPFKKIIAGTNFFNR